MGAGSRSVLSLLRSRRVRPFSLTRAFFRPTKRCIHKNSYGIIGVTRVVVVTVIPVAPPGRNRHKFNVRTVLQCTLNHPRSHLKRALSYCSGRTERVCVLVHPVYPFSKGYEKFYRERKTGKGESREDMNGKLQAHVCL